MLTLNSPSAICSVGGTVGPCGCAYYTRASGWRCSCCDEPATPTAGWVSILTHTVGLRISRIAFELRLGEFSAYHPVRWWARLRK